MTDGRLLNYSIVIFPHPRVFPPSFRALARFPAIHPRPRAFLHPLFAPLRDFPPTIRAPARFSAHNPRTRAFSRHKFARPRVSPPTFRAPARNLPCSSRTRAILHPLFARPRVFYPPFRAPARFLPRFPRPSATAAVGEIAFSCFALSARPPLAIHSRGGFGETAPLLGHRSASCDPFGARASPSGNLTPSAQEHLARRGT